MNGEEKGPENELVDEEADTVRMPPMECEFNVTVQKLEVPVRPRGVLAE